MLSRVAESIYWLSRYIERAENVARFIDVNLELSLDLPVQEMQQWLPLVVTTGDETVFSERYPRPDRAAVLDFLTFDEENPNSILSCLLRARENARSVREVISSEMWRHINRFYLLLRGARLEDALSNPHDFFNLVRSAGQHFVGVTDSTMSHGEGWHFSRLGRYIERADKTSRILDVKYFIILPSVEDVGTPFDDIQWSALLHSASGFEMYRQRHGRISPDRVVEFLLLDKEFPRAVLFCLTKANESLHAVAGSALGTYANPAEQLLGKLQSELAFYSSADLIEHGLHEFVDDLQVRLNSVGFAVHDAFFARQPVATS